MPRPPEDSERLRIMSISLFKEFGEKLAEIRAEAQRLEQQITKFRSEPAQTSPAQFHTSERRCQILRDRFLHLRPALEQFTQRISQRLEFTQIDDIDRIELEIRLAEFENDLRWTNDYVLELSL